MKTKPIPAWPDTLGKVAAMGTFAAASSTSLADNAPLKPVPARPQCGAAWCEHASITLETQFASQLVGNIQGRWNVADGTNKGENKVQGDFIFDMVDPETLALAPAITEYDVDYELEWDELTTAKALEDVNFAPPQSTIPARIVISEIRQGQPHRADMEEFDYDFIESISGAL